MDESLSECAIHPPDRTGDRETLYQCSVLLHAIIRIINRGGEKISPAEVDEALMLCSTDIREAACFSVPDDFFGQEVEAAVVVVNDAQLKEKQITDLLKGRLAEFKIPKRVHFCQDRIPKGEFCSSATSILFIITLTFYPLSLHCMVRPDGKDTEKGALAAICK